jgi:5-bromo-4-chloroindolyl phosphate hydrolysis protein
LLEVKSLNLQRVEENKVLGEKDLDYLRVFLRETSEKIRVLQKIFGCENDKVCEDKRR